MVRLIWANRSKAVLMFINVGLRAMAVSRDILKGKFKGVNALTLFKQPGVTVLHSFFFLGVGSKVRSMCPFKHCG